MEGCVGEESFQMWELNRRLEAYLTRVKTLEEQNQLLSAELGGLRAQSGDASWRARADDELAALRVLVDQRWREKHEAEVQRDNLAEELESVAGRCQQVRLARERTIEEAACSRRALEAEKNARGWLSTQAAELERELEALRASHEEERAHLNAQAACTPRRPPAPAHASPIRAPEVEELARRLGEVWRGAVRDYQERVAHMESSLGQARERLGQAVRGARESRLEVQQLQADRDSLQELREALEQRLEGRWQDRLQATEKFQVRRVTNTPTLSLVKPSPRRYLGWQETFRKGVGARTTVFRSPCSEQAQVLDFPVQTGRMDGILRPPSTAPLKGPQANTHCSCSSLFEWQPLSRVTPCALHYAVVNQKVPNTCSLPTRRFLATIVKEGSVSHRRPPAPLCQGFSAP